MSKNIWKYTLEIAPYQSIDIPTGYKILHIGNQAGNLCMWVEVDVEKQRESVDFIIAGTGHEPPNTKHLGTVIIESYVWHVYEGDKHD